MDNLLQPDPTFRTPRDGIDGKDSTVPGTAGKDSQVPGPAGKDSTVPGPKGDTGKDGIGITWRGLFNRRTEYKPNDAVSFDGSSWICVRECNGREPSDTSRFWNMLAAAGRNGRDGERGGAGPRGPGSGRLNLLQEQVDSLEGGGSETVEAEFDSATAAGMVVYVLTDGHVELAQGDAFETSIPVGLATESVAPGASGDYQTAGPLMLADWTNVIGTQFLSPGEIYFLSTTEPGKMTTVGSDTPGTYVVICGVALTQTLFKIQTDRCYFISP